MSDEESCGVQVMAPEEVTHELNARMDAIARRSGEVDVHSLVLLRSIARKEARKISARETRTLVGHAVYIYDRLCEDFWWDYYVSRGMPYIEESLEIMPDGAVRYSATFLPVRFAPDLPRDEAAA